MDSLNCGLHRLQHEQIRTRKRTSLSIQAQCCWQPQRQIEADSFHEISPRSRDLNSRREFFDGLNAKTKGMFVKHLFSIASLGLACMVGLGCGGSGDKWTAGQPDTVDASGVVTLDGEPVEGATVVFGPVDGKYPANAITASDGSFSAAAFTSKPGAVPGKYKVALTKTIEDKDAKKKKFDPGEDSEHAKDGGGDVSWTNGLPEVYKLPSTTPIEIEVPSDGIADLKIELKTQ